MLLSNIEVFHKKNLGNVALAVGMIVLSLFKLWLVDVYDLMATYTPHDDYLFIRQAKEILQGNWFGNYDHLLLIKGPVYPLFIAFSHLIGIPLLLSQQLLYIAASFFLIYAVKPVSRNNWILLFVFFLVLYNPATCCHLAVSRAFRFGLSISLVLFLFSIMIAILLRLDKRIQVLRCWFVLFGIIATLLWYTREEGIWFIPSILLFALLFVLTQNNLTFLSVVKRACFFVLPLVIFSATTLVFLGLNKYYYGSATIIEIKSPEFQKALGGLMSVAVKRNPRYVPVSKENQDAALSVSPTLRKLSKKFAEVRHGRGFPPSFYIWTFRDIVAKAGYSESLPDALDFYQHVGDELEEACQQGKINCVNRKFSIVPVWYKDYWQYVVPEFWKLFCRSLLFSSYKGYLDQPDIYNQMRTTAPAWMVKDYQDVTRERLASPLKNQLKALPSYARQTIKLKLRILNGVALLYNKLCPLLFCGAFFIFSFFGVMDFVRGARPYLFYLSLVILGGLLSLLSVLTFVSITLWSVGRPLSSSFPLLLLYICMGIFLVESRVGKKDSSVEGLC